MKNRWKRLTTTLILIALPVTITGAGPFPAVPVPDEPLRLEISLSERHLYEFRNGELVNTFNISVGQPGHETPTGEFRIHQVDWNPDWQPPDSPWAQGEEYTPPGHPDNPMGRVRMIFQEPYSIHGTDAAESLGRARSHGSIRMANSEVTELAPRVMAAGGASRSEAWIQTAMDNPTEMRQVELPDPVRLIIYE